MEFPMREYWSRLSHPPPHIFLNQGLNSHLLHPPALAGRFFSTALPGKPYPFPQWWLTTVEKNVWKFKWELIDEQVQTTIIIVCIPSMYTKYVYSVAQSCLTLCNPMDCSLPGSFCPWNFLGRNTGAGCHFLLQGILPTHISLFASLAGRFFTTAPPGKPR